MLRTLPWYGAVAAMHLAAVSAAAQSRSQPPTSSAAERVARLKLVLDEVQEQLQTLRQEIHSFPELAHGPIRRHEPGFRALYTMNRDGTNVEYLVAAPGMIASATPEWSHDGKLVAFDAVAAVDDVNKSRLFVFAVEGPFKGLIRELGYGNTPSWSPDDRQIAFMINPGNPAGERGGVWLMNADGSGRKWIGEGFYPRWSPNGKQLCVHAWLSDGTASLFVIDAATLQVRPILTAAGWELRDYGGTWFDDSQRIVFIGRRDGKDHLATIDVNGGEKSLRILYTNNESGRELFGPPAWSPDGRQIVFGIQPTAAGPRRWWNSRLYSIEADGGSPAVLLEGGKQGNINRGMNWSPDSKKIVFSSER